MTFGPSEKAGARITDLSLFNQVLDKFQSRGYNEVDTARVYVGGQQEAFTREARWKERGLKLATKVKYPSQDGDNVEEKVIESVETSLKELGTDCVDVCAATRPLPLHPEACKQREQTFELTSPCLADPLPPRRRPRHAARADTPCP